MAWWQSVLKIDRGQPLDWHIPRELTEGEVRATCVRCSSEFITRKENLRAMNYCVMCK
jgi:hypothetical protein